MSEVQSLAVHPFVARPAHFATATATTPVIRSCRARRFAENLDSVSACLRTALAGHPIQEVAASARNRLTNDIIMIVSFGREIVHCTEVLYHRTLPYSSHVAVLHHTMCSKRHKKSGMRQSCI